MLLGVLWRNHALTCNAALSFCLWQWRGFEGWEVGSLSLELLNYFSTRSEHGDNLVQTWTFIKRFRLEISLLLRLAVRFARIKCWPQFSKKSLCVWLPLLDIRHLLQCLTKGHLKYLKCLGVTEKTCIACHCLAIKHVLPTSPVSS